MCPRPRDRKIHSTFCTCNKRVCSEHSSITVTCVKTITQTLVVNLCDDLKLCCLAIKSCSELSSKIRYFFHLLILFLKIKTSNDVANPLFLCLSLLRSEDICFEPYFGTFEV